ncbi:MarR family winged helix-turn-helix transcriptional regulator [Saccharibacillus endophyticus]|uniref:HTH-type transcriptional regulator YybA n=1 Tax=Saccharibacillus endophyticus TaxID=2060666 RepID=A0ABQ2A0N7_9BACL|nr:MarR family transcriptional regulator [Saccharibacillus endophyticus]GGH81461.1 putative HTH-type transcriptional regulator YybA [Saccharibacillus endophyticus]
MGNILREVGAIARCFESISNIEFKPYGLSKNQYIYLVRICENPGIIQEEIVYMVKVDRSTASRAIEKLERDGFIQKEQESDNRKNKALYPTEKGKEMYAFLRKEDDYSNAAAVKGLSAEEEETLLRLLQKVRANVEPDWEKVKNGGTREY